MIPSIYSSSLPFSSLFLLVFFFFFKRIALWCISARKLLRDFHFYSSKRITSTISVKFSLRTHCTHFRYPCKYIYIYILVSLRFESSRCMNILIAFDCAAINVARIRNERQKSTLPGLDDIRISRLRSAYKWACNRYRPVDDTMSKASPPSPPLSYETKG